MKTAEIFGQNLYYICSSDFGERWDRNGSLCMSIGRLTLRQQPSTEVEI